MPKSNRGGCRALCGSPRLPAKAGIIYDSIPGPLPPNVPSLGYQAAQTSEFGNLIAFGGAGRDLDHVTVLMSDWALASTYGSLEPDLGPSTYPQFV